MSQHLQGTLYGELKPLVLLNSECKEVCTGQDVKGKQIPENLPFKISREWLLFMRPWWQFDLSSNMRMFLDIFIEVRRWTLRTPVMNCALLTEEIASWNISYRNFRRGNNVRKICQRDYRNRWLAKTSPSLPAVPASIYVINLCFFAKRPRKCTALSHNTYKYKRTYQRNKFSELCPWEQ